MKSHSPLSLNSRTRVSFSISVLLPLGGFSPLQSAALDAAAASLQATPIEVALAWLLHRAPNILLIPGTSSIGHLRENLAAATLELPPEAIAELDQIARAARGATYKGDEMNVLSSDDRR